MKLTILRNDPLVPAGHLDRVARDRCVDVTTVELDAGEQLPAFDEVEAVAILGGGMGVYDTDRYPHLIAEEQWIATAARRGVPMLGLCLGCQLLADALGGSAYLAPTPEVAFEAIDLVTDDAVVGHLGRADVLMMHRDTWDLPEGGRLVARSRRYPQAFRIHNALGVQPHPELTAATAEAWLEHPGSVDLLAGAGVAGHELSVRLERSAPVIAATADAFFGAWFDEVARTLEASR